MSKANEKIILNILGVLLLLVAINAFGGGYYGMAGAEGIPAEWLKGSPFSSYFIPSLILLYALVDGLCLLQLQYFGKSNLRARRLIFPE